MRIGIVNDLPMAAEALRRALRWQPEHEVIWIAKTAPKRWRSAPGNAGSRC